HFNQIGTLFEHALSLLHQRLSDGSDANFGTAPLENNDAQLFFKLAYRHGKGGLAYKASLGCTPEMALASHSHNIFEFSQCHSFSSVENPARRASIVVYAVVHYQDNALVA